MPFERAGLDVRGHHRGDRGGRRLVADQAERLGGAALDERIGIGERRGQRRRRPRRRRSGPSANAAICRTSGSRSLAAVAAAAARPRPAARGPTASAARRRMRGSAILQQREQVAAAGAGASCRSSSSCRIQRHLLVVRRSRSAASVGAPCGAALGPQPRGTAEHDDSERGGSATSDDGGVGSYGLSVPQRWPSVVHAIANDVDADAGTVGHRDGAVGADLDGRLDQIGLRSSACWRRCRPAA